MSELEFHPEAAANFSDKAEGLLPELTTIDPELRQEPFPTQRFVSRVIRPQDVGSLRLGGADFLGRPTGCSFNHDGRVVALLGEGYASLLHLAEAIQKTASFRDRFSVRCLTDLIFAWLEARHRGQPVPRMTDHLMAKAVQQLDDFEVWTPVAHLYVQSPFRLGRVAFTTVTADQITSCGHELLAGDLSATPHVDEWTEQQRKRLQGLGAGIVTIRAEPVRAGELAFAWTEEAVSLLRLFGPWWLHPERVAYCAPLGQEHLPSVTQFLLKGGKLVTPTEGTVLSELDYYIGDEFLRVCRPFLDILDRMLTSPRPTPYQERLLEALALFSRSTLASRPSDKLVYILSALESFLLLSETEPIQTTLGHRMAFFLETTADERLGVIKNVQDVYAKRSRFLHHGVESGALESMRVFMGRACDFFHKAILNAEQFPRREDLIAAIERVRLS